MLVLRAFVLLASWFASGLVPSPPNSFLVRQSYLLKRSAESSENELKDVRRSRLYRLDEATQSLETSPRNASRAAELGSKLQALQEKEELGQMAKEKISKMSERVSAVQKQKIRLGQVVIGRCVELRPFGAMIDLGEGHRPALLHKSEISQRLVRQIDEIIPIDADITCAIVNIDEKGRVSLSTKVLETKPGDMLIDSASVYANAPKQIKVQKATSLKARRLSANKVADAVVDLATDSSLDDLDNQIQRIKKKRQIKQKEKVGDKISTATTDDNQETMQLDTNSPLDLAAAFAPVAPEVKERQRQEEFDLLMNDLVYTPTSSLTDVGKIIRGRKKRGAFTSPFWTKVFPRRSRSSSFEQQSNDQIPTEDKDDDASTQE
mmetsp:Transcript_18000/g.23464  ORF Transcript_18000/g.23464 Transcript_18000/m.23464 type:complete len:378 (-) Transcript_18000:131-1264(-)